ncbi:MAG: HPr family phosphocarrier protein [Gemmataceae bacterium]|nr:HPr family phosphocarrier protein [Gemmataceae bacterium]
MTGPSLQRTVIVANPMGFHLRPMAAFARRAAQFQSTVTLTKEGRRVNGKHMLELMTLAAEQGTPLILDVNGSDATEALEALSEILAAPTMDDDP